MSTGTTPSPRGESASIPQVAPLAGNLGNQASRTPGRKRSVAALRAVLALAAGAASLGAAGNARPAFLPALGIYAAASLVLLFERPAAFLRRAPAMVLFAFDIGAVTALMLLSGEARSQFYVVFFLVILLAGLTRSARAALPVAAIAALAYGVAAGIARPGELLEIGFTTRIAFFFAAAIFAGCLAEESRAERETALRLSEEAHLGRETSRRLTEEVRGSQAAYRRIEDYRRMLFEESADGVLVAGPEGVIRDANARARTLLGRDPAGTTYGEILQLSDTQVLPALQPGGLPVSPIVTADLARPNGTSVTCEIVHKGFKIDGKDHTLFLLRDVGPVRQMHQRMAELEKMSVLGRLLGSLAHEINNPLSIVLGYSEMLAAAPPPPEKVPEYAGHVLEAGKRCQRVLRGFLDQYRLRPFAPALKPLGEIVRGAVGLMDFHLRYHLVRAEVKADDRVFVRADAQQIEQVLINLLTNAVQAMKGRSRRILKIMAVQGPEGPLLEVSDTGCGIPPEHLKAIFDRGFTTKGEGAGHGLGLAVCREIVQRHGGRIDVASRVDQGTTFTLRFPPAPAGPPAA